jgi:ribonuclease III
MDATDRVELERRLSYRFERFALLDTALRHASYAKDSLQGRVEANERLEFLGDAVIGLVVAEWLYHERRDDPEGVLTPMRGRYVSEVALATVARSLDLGRFLALAPGEEGTGGRDRPSNLADAFEAVVGAVYLDGGYEAARGFVETHVLDSPEIAATADEVDPKSALQELVLASIHELPEYAVIDRTGPDHMPTFTVEVRVRGEAVGVASGCSKKLAEREAARLALEVVPRVLPVPQEEA